MRQVRHGLHGAFEPALADFVEQDRKKNAGGPGEDQIRNIQLQRIAQDAPEIITVEEIRKLIDAAFEVFGKDIVISADNEQYGITYREVSPGATYVRY